uniref:Uncharacterized protein n=1 Tax=Anguilla anguilla TaxID=7936 RepID=A0A0E9S4E0_ANGAN
MLSNWTRIAVFVTGRLFGLVMPI